MLDIIKHVLYESFTLFKAMSPYLLLGLFFAGLLHIFISVETIARHLGRNNFWSVLNAVVLGIPLPLCSCGVIPAALMLRKSGASKGAVVSFMIATPITGIDSIFATYSLMGLFFAVYRVLASSLTALFAGVVSNIVFKDEQGHDEEAKQKNGFCPHCQGLQNPSEVKKRPDRFKELFRYGFIQIMGDIWLWLVIGMLIGGAISYLVPATIVERYLGNPLISMLVMLAIGIPMYVCSTGSIPIAASLLMKGMNPGAALVFLLAGPATNAVTITVVAKEIGKRATAIYVGSLVVMSLVMGYILDLTIGWFDAGDIREHIHGSELPEWIVLSSSVLLGLLLAIAIARKVFKKMS